MTEPLLTDDDICRRIDQLAAEGYQTDDELIDDAVEILSDELEQDVAERVRRLAPAVLDAREALERTWPVPTDCDRLDRAFAKLEAAGIIARQDFTCCQTCGHSEIGDEVGAGDQVRGYTFFHRQDTESAARGEGLCLAYGAFLAQDASKEEYGTAAVRIGHEVVAALRAEGLEPSWNGDLGRRITLPLVWQRRRRRR